MKLFTIGVYGWSAEEFSRSINETGITSLVDVRRRRGVRGPLYRFANATALERLVTHQGIRYIAEPRLAPSQEMRALQKDADKKAGATKSSRARLSPTFVHAYRSKILSAYSRDMLDQLLAIAGERPALLCVEREAEACHRSVLASWIAEQTGFQVINLTP